jgi:hypothetical protein
MSNTSKRLTSGNIPLLTFEHNVMFSLEYIIDS